VVRCPDQRPAGRFPVKASHQKIRKPRPQGLRLFLFFGDLFGRTKTPASLRGCRRRPSNDRLRALSVIASDCRQPGPSRRQAIEGVRQIVRISSSGRFGPLICGPKSSSEIRSVFSAFRTSKPPRFQRPRSNGQLIPGIVDTIKPKMEIYCLSLQTYML